MTTAGEINVKLGLNSDSFIKEMDKAEKELKELESKLKTSETQFNAVAKAMAMSKNPSKELQSAFKQLKEELKQNKSAFDDFNSKLNKFDGGLTKSSNIVDLLRGAFGKLIAGGTIIAITKQIIEMGKAAVNTAAKFESLATSFEVLTGGAEAGKMLTDQIVELAAKTPLTTETLTDGARTLLSFGESANEVVNDLKLLGDITGGDAQRMQSLTLAFAQIGSTGRLAGQDLLQMINAGFNPLQIISEKTGKSVAQLKDEMSKGLITYKDVKQAMIDATSEGGRFYGMMNKQSETLDGRLSTLSDTWQLVSKTIGDKFLPTAKAATDAMIDIGRATQKTIEWLESEDFTLKHLIQSWGKYWASKRKGEGMVFEVSRDWLTKQRESGIFAKDVKNEIKKQQKEIDKGFNAVSSTGSTKSTKGSKQKQDKSLEEFKKYIEEYARLTSNYEATLKARQYIEGTLNIDPIKQKEEYDKMLAVYQQHYAKIEEIAQSGAKNKAEIEKLEEEKLVRDLQEIRLTGERDTQRQIAELSQNYAQQAADLEHSNSQSGGFLTGFMGGISSQYKAKLDLEKWYQQERYNIEKQGYEDSEQLRQAYENLETLKIQKQAENNLNSWQNYGNNFANILDSSFTNILQNNDSFGDAMLNMINNLSKEILKIVLSEALKEIEIEKMLASAKMFFRSLFGMFSFGGSTLLSGGSIISSGGMALANINTGIGPIARADYSEILPKYHSGGFVPGTKEQLAVLQGGERVLNRAENVNYSNGESQTDGINNIIVFNIKAWDGKDVINTLKANANTIQQITASGIKDNKQGLRTIIQNT